MRGFVSGLFIPLVYMSVFMPVLYSLITVAFHLFIYYPHLKTCPLILERERGREGEREGEKHPSFDSHMCPDQGPNMQPRHVPWWGIKPATFWFIGWCSNQLGHTGQGWLLSLCSKCWNQEVWDVQPCSFFQDCFGYLGVLGIPDEFWDGFFYFCKKWHWDFDRDWIESILLWIVLTS